MQVDIKEPNRVSKLQANVMKIGQVGVVVEDNFYKGQILLRIFSGFVSLTHPNSTWSDKCTLDVRILPPGTKITLTLEK